MLERATGCLETGSRCFLASQKLLYRSRRSLHSSFWIHGAGSISLPSWWLLLLQPPPEEIFTPHITDTAPKYLAVGLATGLATRNFLDFLYPQKTVTLIHKLASSDVTRSQSRLLRRPRPSGLRSYSGDTAEALASHADGNHIMDMFGFLPEGASTSVARVEADVVAREPAREPHRESNSRSILRSRLERAWERHRILEGKAIDTSQRGTDQAGHQSQEATQQSLENIHTIGAELLGSYAAEILEQFYTTRPNDRSPKDYRLAIISAISSEELDMAIEIATEGMTRRYFEATAVLMPHLLMKREWDGLILLWQKFCSEEDANINRFLGSMGELSVNKLLIGARKLCLYLARKRNDLRGNEQVQELASGLAKLAFSSRNTEFSLIYHFRLFNLIQGFLESCEEHFHLAVEQLLLFQGTDALLESAARKAISIYAMMRTPERLVPKQGLMEFLIQRLCQHGWVDLTDIVLTDHERFYGRPSLEVLGTLWRTANREGSEVFRTRLTENYGQIRVVESSIDRFNQELTFYFRRLEIDKLLRYFEFAPSALGLTPDAQSWNIVLMLHARIPDIEGAQTWYGKMRESGIRPNSLTYRTLANMYAAAGDLVQVQRLIDESQNAGHTMHSSLIDSTVYALIKNQELDRAESLVASAADMTLIGARTRMWNYLLSGVALRGDLLRVKFLHDQMLAAGVDEDEMTYAALMLCLCVRGLPKYAYSILRKFMPTQNRIRVLPIHFAIVFGGFASKEMWGEVFNAYRFMISLGLRPSWSAQTTFLKAVTKHEMKRLKQAGAEPSTIYLRQAETLLDDFLSNLDAMDLRTQEPLKGVDDQRLDEAYLANYFEFLIFSYGRSGNMTRVSALFDRYMAMAQARSPGESINPPIKMITALMGSLLEQNLHENIEQLWQLALTKARAFASSPTLTSDAPASILPGRRFILTGPLTYYLRSLTAQSRTDDITSLLYSLEQQGYAIINSAWNLYVEALLSADHHEQAFAVAEAELMPGWRGWPIHGGYALAIKLDLRRQLPTTMHTSKRMPTYLVLVRLAAAYADIRRRGAFHPEQTKPLEELARIAPIAVRAVREMPRMDDEVQAKYLRRW